MKTVQSAVADLLCMHGVDADHADHLAEILMDAFAIVARHPSLLVAE